MVSIVIEPSDWFLMNITQVFIVKTLTQLWLSDEIMVHDNALVNKPELLQYNIKIDSLLH